MDEPVGRRTVLALLSTAMAHHGGVRGSADGTPSVQDGGAAIGTVYDEIIRAESVDDLEDPVQPPAFAITDAGVWEWTEDGNEWQPLSLSADALTSRDGEPVPVFGAVDLQDHDVIDVDSLDAAQMASGEFTQHIAEWSELPAEAIVNRPIATTAPVELFVDPDGNDGNEGTESDPLATLQEALNRLPFLLQHEVRIELADGTYDDHVGGLNTAPHVLGNVNEGSLDQAEAFTIVGNPDDPSSVYVTDVAKFNFTFVGTAIHRTKIEGLELDCSVVNYGGRMTVENCVINGNQRDLSGVTGYQSHTRVDSCTFTDGLDYAVGPGNMGRAIVDECDGHVSKYVFNPRTGAEVVDRGNSITATYGLYDTKTMDSGGTYKRAGGVVPTENAVLCDDFGDGRLFDRRISTSATYRPQWRDPGGKNPVVEEGYIEFRRNAVDRIEVDHTFSAPPGINRQWLYTVGEWTVDYRFEFEEESSGAVVVYLINDGSQNGWNVRLGSDRVTLRKQENGETSSVIETSVEGDTDRHSVSIERSPADEWIVRRDGEEVASETDPFLPDARRYTPFEIRGAGFSDDGRAEVHNIAFYNR